MADGWDDWGDGDDNQSHNSEKSEGWDWPAEEGSSAAAVIPATTRTSPSVAAESNSRTEDAEAKARTARAVNEMTDKFFSELRRYQEDLADPCVREEINKELSKVDFSSLAGYYGGRDDLAAYTIETELRRMRYSVVTERGDRVGDGEGGGEEEDGGSKSSVRDFLSERKGHAMMRMANQSIFADMLEALQGRLIRPDLEISVVSRDCEFTLDFSRGVLEAQSLFGVSTVGSGQSGTQETLEIAQIKGTTCIDTRNETCNQRLLSPQLRMVFDDHMRASARVLANHCLMGGGIDVAFGDVGGGGQRGGTGLQGMGALRQSLARVGSDGMGRAAAAGTGILANVVAGVGSAIGASRTSSDEHFGGGGTDTTTASIDVDNVDAPLRLYRRTIDCEEEAEETTGRSVTPRTASGIGGRVRAVTTARNVRSGSPPLVPATAVPARRPVGVGGISDSFVGTRVEGTVQGSAATTRYGSPILPPGIGSEGRGAAGIDRRSEEEGISSSGAVPRGAEETRTGLGFSALGVASATGGAVLRGLWGGFQGVQSFASASIEGGGEEGDAGSGGGYPTPTPRLYRRDDGGDS